MWQKCCYLLNLGNEHINGYYDILSTFVYA